MAAVAIFLGASLVVFVFVPECPLFRLFGLFASGQLLNFYAFICCSAECTSVCVCVVGVALLPHDSFFSLGAVSCPSYLFS